MPRPRATSKRADLHIVISAKLKGQLRRHLTHNGVVPQGAYQVLFEDLIRRELAWWSQKDERED